MKQHTKKAVFAAFMAACLTLSLAACSSTTSSSTDETEEQSSQSTTQEEDTAEQDETLSEQDTGSASGEDAAGDSSTTDDTLAGENGDAAPDSASGTDGASSNNCLDMFREMFLTTGLAKLRDKNASAVDAGEVLKMATVNGAHAMGLDDCDCLAPGKKADMIMIDLHQPNMQPLNNIAKNIVYSGSKQNVKMTMVDGRILYYDGNFLNCEDPEALYEKANEIIQRLSRD